MTQEIWNLKRTKKYIILCHPSTVSKKNKKFPLYLDAAPIYSLLNGDQELTMWWK